jgi:predicted dienelactone hydrolase
MFIFSSNENQGMSKPAGSALTGTILAMVATWVGLLGQGAPPSHAGYQVLRIEDPARTRPIQLDVWYPTSTDETTHNYGLSTGRIASNAPVTPGRLPVILLSHGALGAATNYSWIAEHLARSGYLVVGVSHFGESPVFGQASVDPTTVSHFGVRTRDLSFVLDFVVERSRWASQADRTRVGALGHSSGGATMAMLAGGQYQPQAMAAYCNSQAGAEDRGCRYPRGTGIADTEAPSAARGVRAMVLLDPAVGPGMTQASLADLTIPTLVVGSVDNDFIPFAANAERYARLIPNAAVLRLDRGEGHFVYLDECSLPIEAMGVPLCTDRPGVVRRDVHARLADRIVQFFSRYLG